MKKSNDQFLLEIKNIVGDEYTFLEEYKNCDTKIKVRHNICGHEYKVTPNKFFNNRRCPNNDCKIRRIREKRAKTNKQFKNEVHQLVGNDYIILGEYVNIHTKILIKHNIKDCNHEWEITPASFLHNGSRCPICSVQKGKNHYNWKGGKTNLIYYLRRHIDLWRQDSIKMCNYKCIISNNRFDIIHHLYSFNNIVDELLNILKIPLHLNVSNYTEEQLDLFKSKCLELHYKYGFGVCLTEELHKEFHKIYGMKDFTPENFQEFYYLKTGKIFNLGGSLND